MVWHAIKRDVLALIIAIILLILGLSAVWLSKIQIQTTQINNDYYYAALILAPIFVYAIASGRLKQLNAGGLGIVLEDVARQQIKPEPIKTFGERPIETEKEGVQDLGEKIRNIRRQLIREPQKFVLIVLTLYLDEQNQDNRGNINCSHNNSNYSRYGMAELLKYIKKLSKFPSFKLVVILDRHKKVNAYISLNRLQNILPIDNNHYYNDETHYDDDETFREFIEAINQGNLDSLIGIPGIVTTTIGKNNTNIDALRIMNDQEIDILAVVDENGLLSGAIEREQLLNKFLAKIILDME